jgi:hypothetical protein
LMSDDDMLKGAAPASVPRMIVFPQPCTVQSLGLASWSLVSTHDSIATDPVASCQTIDLWVPYLPRAFEGFRHERGGADALEAVIGAAAGHLRDDLQVWRSSDRSVKHDKATKIAALVQIQTSLTAFPPVSFGFTKSVIPNLFAAITGIDSHKTNSSSMQQNHAGSWKILRCKQSRCQVKYRSPSCPDLDPPQ